MLDPETFNVLVAAPELPPLDKVAQVMARFSGGVAFDARQKAKRSWGFLGENLDAAGAERLAALSAEAGLPARVVSADRVVVTPAPASLHWLRAVPEGLYYTVGTSDSAEKSAAWEQVLLVAAAPLKETSTSTKTVKEGPSDTERAVGMGILMVTGIPVGMGKAKEVKKTVQSSELFVYLDLFVEGPEGLKRLHVDGQKFNYAALGDAHRADVMGNFRLLLQGVDRFAGGALRNLGARGFLSGRPLSALGYDSSEDYEKEVRWLLSIPRK